MEVRQVESANSLKPQCVRQYELTYLTVEFKGPSHTVQSGTSKNDPNFYTQTWKIVTSYEVLLKDMVDSETVQKILKQSARRKAMETHGPCGKSLSWNGWQIGIQSEENVS